MQAFESEPSHDISAINMTMQDIHDTCNDFDSELINIPVQVELKNAAKKDQSFSFMSSPANVQLRTQ